MQGRKKKNKNVQYVWYMIYKYYTPAARISFNYFL